ncbi:LRR domain containing protein [Parasponia andersonii]|uniref:LRR domain containing protein n=1 Tax=Parasponia andersonii TaxID=3476 RepID=A0A2P5AX39_PARAD|nr:LRR domain containing protein [Parasponia andersonii]
MEEIAEQYLRELIDRCMIQVGKWDHTGVGVKTCRVARLMRDFCVSKAREDKFFQVIQQNEKNITTASSSSTHQTSSRRIAIHPGRNLDRIQMHRNLRSLMWFDSSPFSFLKITRMRHAGNVTLSSSIGNLRNMGTINLRDNSKVVLPMEILKLTHLKHLLLPFATCFSDGSFSFETYFLSNPTQIQTLKYLRFGPFLLENKITQSELSNLRNLGIQFVTREEVGSFLAFPNFKLSMLQSLRMSLLSINVAATL